MTKRPKKKLWKRIVSAILIIVIIFSIFPLYEKWMSDKERGDYWKKKQYTDVIDWDALGENCVAYLVLDNIQYPVMQDKDDKFYLHHLPDGTENYGGSLFLYSKNMGDFSDKNSIIFGHNMASTSKYARMFGDLKNYKSAGYKDHTFVIYYPDGTKRTYQFFSEVRMRWNSPLYRIAFNGDSGFLDWQKELVEKSYYKNSIEPDAKNKIVSLSTCDGLHGTSWRFLLSGVEVKREKVQNPASWWKKKEAVYKAQKKSKVDPTIGSEAKTKKMSE